MSATTDYFLGQQANLGYRSYLSSHSIYLTMLLPLLGFLSVLYYFNRDDFSEYKTPQDLTRKPKYMVVCALLGFFIGAGFAALWLSPALWPPSGDLFAPLLDLTESPRAVPAAAAPAPTSVKSSTGTSHRQRYFDDDDLDEHPKEPVIPATAPSSGLEEQPASAAWWYSLLQPLIIVAVLVWFAFLYSPPYLLVIFYCFFFLCCFISIFLSLGELPPADQVFDFDSRN